MRHVIVTALQVATVALAVLSVGGVVLMRDALDRLHYTGPAGLAGICAAAAVLVQGGLSLIGTRAILLAAILLVTTPVLTHATAHAVDRRERQR